MKMNINKKSGFTLVELVVVMIILGILAGTAISKLGGSDEGAYIASMKADSRQAIAAANNVYVSESAYPDPVTLAPVSQKKGGAPILLQVGGVDTDVTLTSSPGNTVSIAASAGNAATNCATTDGYLITVTNPKVKGAAASTITFDSCVDAGIIFTKN